MPVAQLARWVNKLVPTLTAFWKVIEINGHVGNIVREVFEINLSDRCELESSRLSRDILVLEDTGSAIQFRLVGTVRIAMGWH